MKAINIKTEYLINPLGIDVQNPRVFWNCEGGITQTAYRIKSEKWDSGKIESSSMYAQYPLGLVSGERVNFQIKLWDENDKEGEWSEPAFFEMGILRKGDWSAKWITGDYRVNKKNRYPVDCFKKEFTADGKVKSARLYITACGIYSAEVNGERVSMPLAPGITDYTKRVQYQTYDVTELIKENNAVTAELADGWYRGSCGAWGLRNQYGTETKILAQLEITYENGKKKTVVTDDTWQWSDDGAIRFADNKDGEIVEADKTPSYSGRAKITSHNVVPTASNNVPIAEKETFKGKMTVSHGGKRLLDFGQNFAGYISFKVNAKAGQKIVFRFGELLKDGELYQKNIQLSTKKKTTPLQRIEYTCKEGVNEYKTKFAIFGFQYAEIDTDVEITADDVTAIAVYSDMEETGVFNSSNGLLNKLVEATRWSTKSNSTDLPTDCPTRERHGWTGDAQIFFTTASYLFDYRAFSKKYLRDVFDWQKKDGKLPQIAPAGGVDFYMDFMNGSVGWADAGVLIPWRFYEQYGDRELLSEYYERMKKYAAFMQSHCGKFYPTEKHIKGISLKDRKYLNNYGQAYGEWAEPTEVNPQTWKTCVITHPETATAYTSYVMECMAEIAVILGRDDEAQAYREFSENNKNSYQALMRSKTYSLDTDRQAQLVRALYFDMLDSEQKEYAKDRLIKALDSFGWRLGTGFLSTPLILYVLADINIDYAYRLLENEKMPGWLYMPKMGATTIWESWEGTEAQGGIASLNHYSKGAVCEWLFKEMCGINIDGENHFVIAPKAGGSFTYANAEYKSVYGTVKSGWIKTEIGYNYEIEIPANCTAKIIINGKTQSVNAGKYVL